MPDALPAATLPIYPGLGQAPNMLACIPSGLVSHNYRMTEKQPVNGHFIFHCEFVTVFSHAWTDLYMRLL